MKSREFIDVEHNVSMTIYVFRYSDGSAEIRTLGGSKCIDLSADEAKAVGKILSRPAKPMPKQPPLDLAKEWPHV